jgi:SAM-dependent methyltransferase
MTLSWLKEPTLMGLKSGTPEFFAVQKNLILQRSLLKRSYDDWYRRLLEDAHSAPAGGSILELGSGGSYLKELDPTIITSDVAPDIAEKVVDARSLPFADRTLRAMLLSHVFHHIPDVDAFFREAERTLIPGGVVSMIEVAHTPFARFFFRHFHHEPYEDQRPQWTFAQKDSMMDSNQALSWMVFERDRQKFETSHPSLKLEKADLMPWLTYFCSGGVTMRYLIPRWMNPPLIGLEWLLKPVEPLFSLYWHIRLRKIKS